MSWRFSHVSNTTALTLSLASRHFAYCVSGERKHTNLATCKSNKYRAALLIFTNSVKMRLNLYVLMY